MKTDSMSRNLEVEILQRIAVATQRDIADKMSVDPSTVHRIVSGESGIKISALADFFTSINMKLVDASQTVIDAEELNALQYLAERGIKRGRLS